MNIEHEGEARCMECDASIMCLFVMFFVVFVVDHHVLLLVVVEVLVFFCFCKKKSRNLVKKNFTSEEKIQKLR